MHVLDWCESNKLVLIQDTTHGSSTAASTLRHGGEKKSRLFARRIKPRGSGRIKSGKIDGTRPVRVGKPPDPTRPDPTRDNFISYWPDPRVG